MARGHAAMTTQDEMLKALRKAVAENQQYTTWTVSTPHLLLLWETAQETAQELEREACLARAGTALLGADRALRNRVLKAIRTGGKS